MSLKKFLFAMTLLGGGIAGADRAAAEGVLSDPTPAPAGFFKFPNNEEHDGITRAFPGAEGAGMYTTGGRGGAVYHVTNLNDSGPGSLREAIGKWGKRTIVFDVAGTIELKSKIEIKHGDLTIAGQTAPGNGICIKDNNMEVKADNVIIRYIHFRPGDENPNDGLDAIWGRYHKHIILDHCSMSWSVDECSSFYTNQNFTMQWCLLGESLRNTKHNKGSHGYGGIWGGAPASFHHNLVAHHDSRNPRFDSPNTYSENIRNAHGISLKDRAIDFRNNVIYNFCNFPAYGGEGAKINFVGNVYKWGPASMKGAGPSYKYDAKTGMETESNPNQAHMHAYFYQVDGTYTTGGKTYDEGAAHLYIGNNSNKFDSSIAPSATAGASLTADNKSGFVLNEKTRSTVSPHITWLDAPLAIVDKASGAACDVTTHDANTAFDLVCTYAGASLQRDAVDAHIAADTRDGKATYAKGSRGSQQGIIDAPSDVGGYPTYAATADELAKIKDSDGDGMPDWFEDRVGLDKNKNDANEYTFDKRYTNLELYLHYLVQDITIAQTAGGTYTSLQ